MELLLCPGERISDISEKGINYLSSCGTVETTVGFALFSDE